MRIYKAKGEDMINDPSIARNFPITIGCIVQQVDNILGGLGRARHNIFSNISF